MAEFVLDRLRTRDKVIVQAMVDFAVHWDDNAMWTRVVRASGGDKSIDILGKDRFIGAWKALSFEAVRGV